MIYLATKGTDGRGPPSPVDGNPAIEWPYKRWAKLASLVAAYGATVFVLPPVTKGAALGAGFDIFSHHDFGSQFQRGRRETRYGSVEDAIELVASCRAAGMEVYANQVPHHVDGDAGDYAYRYVGADGKTLNGRFPKDKGCFWTEGPQNPDTVADPGSDWGFGRAFRWHSGTYGDGRGQNGLGYVERNLAEALDYQTRSLGLDGYFLDDVKGTSKEFVRYLLSHPGIVGKVTFSEYSDGNTDTLLNWMQETEQRSGVLDFALKYKLNNVLNNPGNADMRQLLSEGVLWRNPAKAVTFLDNFDTDYSDPIVLNQLLGHAMLLTWPGYPMLLGHSLYAPPDGYGLMDPTLNLIWCHETFAKGDHVWRWLDYNFLVYERMGDHTSSGMLGAVNNRPGKMGNPHDWISVNVQCKWCNQQLHDYTGHANDVWTDSNGNVTLWIPPNDNGHGYVAYAVPGIVNDIHLAPRRMSHTFFGADDLYIPAARDGGLTIGRVTAAKGTMINSGAFTYEKVPGAKILVFFLGADGVPVTGRVSADGDYEVHAVFSGFPPEGTDYEVTVDYMAPRLPVVVQ